MPTTRNTRKGRGKNDDRGFRARYDMPPAPPSSPLENETKPQAPLKPPGYFFQNALLEQAEINARDAIKNEKEMQLQEIENRSMLHTQENLVRAQVGQEEVQARRGIFKQVFFEHAGLKTKTSPNKRAASPTDSFFKVPKPEVSAAQTGPAPVSSREELPVGNAWWCAVM